MRKENPARYSSAVGEAWMHCEFKIKYCHNIFDDEVYREGMRTLLFEARAFNKPITPLVKPPIPKQLMIEHSLTKDIFLSH